MSARKKVNRSRPRALACGDALAVAGAVCFNAASDGRPTSARRSSRPPSNSSASVDSPSSPAPSGNHGVGFGRMPLASGPPHSSDLHTAELAARSIGVCSQVLKYAKGGNFEKCCEFRKHWVRNRKFQVPTSAAELGAPISSRTQNFSPDLLAGEIQLGRKRRAQT